ncbi:MAG: LysM peptidoglycan-binding domain-containing protein, partial [Bdellovibrionaceae bacterium]|nr:LysM peptidoglycan-binding domain-containing protein [Pseudobdellovibrionaceae bacterium]
ESGFSSRAVSHASAVGYWQFIRGTGKRYGLRIDQFVDERRDPVLATQAAADYFKGLYSVFGSWNLAMASYNVGENRVKKEVMRHQTRDFWELAKKKALPRETINYVPKFIAAKMIARNPDKYGFDGIDYLPPIEFDVIEYDKPVNLRVMADKLNYPYEDFKDLNPKYKGEIAPPIEGRVVLRVPVGMKEASLAAAAEATVGQIQFIADSGETDIYRVKAGDTLSGIAKRFRTNVAYLRELNDLPRGRTIRVGQRLIVPDRTPLAARRDAKQELRQKISRKTQELKSDSGTARYYIVQSGDSLYTIARRYNTSVEVLKRLNNLENGRILKTGLKLRLPESGTEVQEEGKKSVDSGRRAPARAVRVHVVRRGETLIKIARRYNVNISAIKKENRSLRGGQLIAGTRIVIPNSSFTD